MRNNRMDDEDQDLPDDFFSSGKYDDEHDPEGDEEEYQRYQDQANIEAELDLQQAALMKDVLGMAVDMCQKQWFWNFRSLQSRMVRINQTYRILLTMLEDNRTSAEEEEQ